MLRAYLLNGNLKAKTLLFATFYLYPLALIASKQILSNNENNESKGCLFYVNSNWIFTS